jgi:heme-degrading monooxygenase HmoA
MPASPWKRLAEVDPGREYLAVVTYLPLARYGDIQGFLGATRAVARQLETSPGAVGYTLLARIPTKRFWTLSVWEDAAALVAFARAQPHRDLMHSYGGRLSGFHIARWQISGSSVPPAWRDARSRAQASGEKGASAG